ncbi:MAG: hypothetical protein HFH68_04455 [Lachnospiraceae bacterium]|nr:hypothetical protein [Lachnospiraceae bacterium]
MKSIRFRVDGNRFVSPLSYANIDIPIMFDTGAVQTVIGLKEFLDNGIDIKDELIKSMRLNGINKVTFTSASNNKIEAYPCKINNIKLGGIELDIFKFYLDISDTIVKPLLGMDFIRHCKFSYLPHEDIKAYLLDKTGYDEYIKKEKCSTIFYLDSSRKC